MNKIKLIALDIDGTLLNSKGEVSKKNQEAIAYAERKGIYVILATGRMYRSANHFAQYFSQYPFCIFCFNCSIKTSKIIHLSPEIISFTIKDRSIRYTCTQ